MTFGIIVYEITVWFSYHYRFLLVVNCHWLIEYVFFLCWERKRFTVGMCACVLLVNVKCRFVLKNMYGCVRECWELCCCRLFLILTVCWLSVGWWVEWTLVERSVLLSWCVCAWVYYANVSVFQLQLPSYIPFECRKFWNYDAITVNDFVHGVSHRFLASTGNRVSFPKFRMYQ